MDITNLIQATINKSPTDFASNFNDIMADKIESALETRKIEVAQEIYGNAEVEDNSVPDDINVDIDLAGLENIDVGGTDE